MKQPKIGDMVHFVNGASLVHLPAIVAKVWNAQIVNLFVIPNGSEVMGQGYTATSIVFLEEPKPQTWHYPEEE